MFDLLIQHAHVLQVSHGGEARVLRDHEWKEPTWCRAREENLVISSDCTDAGPCCFCTMLGDEPHPSGNFDLNLSPHDGGWWVEVGSPKGEELVVAHPDLFQEAGPDAGERRDGDRRKMTERVEEINRSFHVRDPFETSVEKNLKTRIWGRLAATCVECNACNMVCPTCHCFLFEDVPSDDGALRVRRWDSCFHAGHARMAGGGTPRLQLTERFKNHYHHKFVSFPRNWGVTACTGCGRCIDACMGRIDKRECLHRLETEWIPSEVLDELE
jgi:formate hydrogenlyase subunit 6/NADH:ubiquinone oxidoreductase subunit I